MATNYWDVFVHNYDRYSTTSLIIEGADGFHVVERQHGKLIDCNAGYWCVPFGHDRNWLENIVASHPPYYAHMFGQAHPASFELARELTRRSGIYDRVSFSTSGSEAVETAIRMAYQCLYRSNRTGWVTLEHGFHGTTSLCRWISGFEDRRVFLPYDIPVHQLGRWVFRPHLTRAEADHLLNNEPIDWTHLAGFIFEPIQGVAGARILNPHAYAAIAERCHANGTLVIADEVTTALGRFGRFLASEELTPQPDIVALGKALGGGFFPISATLMTSAVYQLLEQSTSNEAIKWLYGGTFVAQPLGCSLALAVLNRLTPELLLQVHQAGRWLANELAEIAASNPTIKRISGRDLMWAVSFSDQLEAKYYWQRLLQAGYLVALEGRKLMLVPALTMPREMLAGAMDALRNVLETD